MKCSYCRTEQEQKKICSFCGANLEQNRPQMKQDLSQEEAYQSQPILATYHTYDLMLFLSYIRAERSSMYKTMQNVRKAPAEAKKDNYDEINEYSQELYRELTARKNIIEQILVDRMGYKPSRVDQKLLEALKAKIERDR